MKLWINQGKIIRKHDKRLVLCSKCPCFLSIKAAVQCICQIQNRFGDYDISHNTFVINFGNIRFSDPKVYCYEGSQDPQWPIIHPVITQYGETSITVEFDVQRESPDKDFYYFSLVFRIMYLSGSETPRVMPEDINVTFESQGNLPCIFLRKEILCQGTDKYIGRFLINKYNEDLENDRNLEDFE